MGGCVRDGEGQERVGQLVENRMKKKKWRGEM